MALTVLNVAYPFAPVTPETAGGAEQILAALDRALCAAGHRSIVIADARSQVAGRLISLPSPSGHLDNAAIAFGHRRVIHAIAAELRRCPVDVVHMHGVDFSSYVPTPGVPVLVTLHLPWSYYPAHALRPRRPETWFNCVSAYQHRSAPSNVSLLPPIENGVEIGTLRRHARRRFALMLSRICPEKGVHLAIDAAKRADTPLLIGGALYRYASHDRYFERAIRPRLDRYRRYLGPLGPWQKSRLLADACCVLVPSLVPETSSLVAREAAAAGTPVIAFARGALSEVVRHGETGFLVANKDGMAAAIGAAHTIVPEQCRNLACERFSLDRMTSSYLTLYEKLARRRRPVVGARGAA